MPMDQTAHCMITKSSTPSAFRHYSSISFKCPAGACSLSESPVTAVRQQTGATVGSPSIPMSGLTFTIRFTGLGSIKTGTSCAQTAIPPRSAGVSIWRHAHTRLHIQRSRWLVRPATDPGQITSRGQKKQQGWKGLASTEGVLIALDERRNVAWSIDSATGNAHRGTPRTSEREIQMCARCYSRRAQIHEDYVHCQPLGDDYRVALLDDDLHYPDGQIKGEVYEYGSFIQSKMFHEGVTGSDCHDPHRLKLHADGNRVSASKSHRAEPRGRPPPSLTYRHVVTKDHF